MSFTMAQKFLFFVYFVSSCRAILVDTNSNLRKDSHKQDSQTWQHPMKTYTYYGNKYHDHHAYPKYEFEYAVSDHKTGDHKSHRESRDGDRVHGEYSLVEADGSLRKVQYDADDYNGFNAVVSKTINKHGDHAYSVTDHTRHFYPIGHGIKINHFFPTKDYHYNPTTENVQIESHETEEEAKAQENVMPMSGDKVAVLEPVKLPEQIESKALDITKVKVTDTSDEVIPGVVPMIMNKHEIDAEPAKLIEESKLEIDGKNTDEEHGPDSSHDSDVASSYYHTRFYYVGF